MWGGSINNSEYMIMNNNVEVAMNGRKVWTQNIYFLNEKATRLVKLIKVFS